jgi:biopolymer transport protein ExbD
MMAFGSFDSGAARPMAEINTTPLVDVMLVLLIIFLVTAPLMTSSIKVDLPRTPSSASSAPKPPEKPLRLSLDAAGALYWDNEPLAETELEARLAATVNVNPQLEVHLAADRNTRYQRVADLMATARRAGVTKMGFVSAPKPTGDSSDPSVPSANARPRPEGSRHRPESRGQDRHGRRHSARPNADF